MARRFGGKYSPTPRGDELAVPETDPAKAPVGLRANLLFALPFLFLIKAFWGSAAALFPSLGAAGLLLLSAWLNRDGLRAQAAYDARKVARRPAIPRKIFAAFLTGLALLLASIPGASNPIYPYLFGLLGAFLHLGAFGLDPLRDKGMTGVDPFQTGRVAKAVEEAERHLAEMRDAIIRAGDRSLEDRVERFAGVARSLFRSVESDPGDLTAARQYLSVYLTGARDATIKFADIYARSKSQRARADYEALLADLETNFVARTKALLVDNHTDLDIEIAVLRDRLKFEG